MRPVRTACVTLSLVLAGSLAATAQAGEKGIGISPARQLVTPDQLTTEVIVSNPGDEPVRAVGKPYVHRNGTWEFDSTVGIFMEPQSFRLKPGTQKVVTVILPDSATNCTLMGVGFQAKVKSKGQVQVSAVGIAQFAVEGAQGTEADCLAVIPKPSAAPTTATGGGELQAGLVTGGGFLVLTLLILGFVWRRSRKDNPKRGGWDSGF